MQKLASNGDNESSQTIDKILSIGFNWAREALLECIEKNDSNLFSRSWIADKFGARAANPGGEGGDTSPQYLTSIPPITSIFAQRVLTFLYQDATKILRGRKM